MGNTLATEAGGENVDKNYWHGNTNSTASRSGPSSNKTTTPPPGKGPQLQRKGSSFLEEPITHKLTERGEAIVSLPNNENNSNEEVELQPSPSILLSFTGREGINSSSINDAFFNSMNGGIGGSNGNKMRYAVSEMQGWRSHMEDKHALNPSLVSTSSLPLNSTNGTSSSMSNSSRQQQHELLKNHHLFAVFDGHGGDFASHYCGTHLVDTLTSQDDWLEYLKLCERTNSTISSLHCNTTNNNRGKVSKKILKQKQQLEMKGLSLLKSALHSTFLELDTKLMDAQRSIRISQLSQIESLVYSYNSNHELISEKDQYDVFIQGTSDYERIMMFDRQLPNSMPPGIPLERSGSTGVVVLITPNHIICANSGDSRGILSKSNSEVVLPLSFDHKPTNDGEVTRIENDDGFVRGGRVDGDLAVSRSFGDFGYKNCYERNIMKEEMEERERKGIGRSLSNLSSSSRGKNTKEKKKNYGPKDHRVTVTPDILVYKREPTKDEFIVLACDGIWDRLSNKDCSDLVKSLIHDEGETDVGLICEEVIDTALELDSRDNMTCCVVLFPPSVKNTSNVGLSLPSPSSLLSTASGSDVSTYSGVLKRRIDRERSWGDDSTPAKRAHERLEERRRKHREMLALQKAKAASSSSSVTTKIQAMRRPSAQAAAATASKKARVVRNNLLKRQASGDGNEHATPRQ